MRGRDLGNGLQDEGTIAGSRVSGLRNIRLGLAKSLCMSPLAMFEGIRGQSCYGAMVQEVPGIMLGLWSRPQQPRKPFDSSRIFFEMPDLIYLGGSSNDQHAGQSRTGPPSV